MVLLLRKVISAFRVSKMPKGAMDFLWGEYLLGFRREQLKISPSVTEGTRDRSHKKFSIKTRRIS